MQEHIGYYRPGSQVQHGNGGRDSQCLHQNRNNCSDVRAVEKEKNDLEQSNKKEVPEALLEFQKFNNEYGNGKDFDKMSDKERDFNLSGDMIKLENIVNKLLETDPEFESYLSKAMVNMVREGIFGNDGLFDAFVNALSSRAKEFGVKIE